ncbi:MAG: hypothetical protein ABI947_02160, partial [Chloroflexota bacterium]
MSVTTVNSPVSQTQSQVAKRVQPEGLWLRNRNWDTLFMTLSVFLVPMPYLFYLLGMQLGFNSDLSRNFVNITVALLVGGPHMYATFMRTALDEKFVKRYPMLIRSSVIIPIVVVSLAFLNLTLLLTVFFTWAAIHVLHQVTYVVELYNHREGTKKGKSATTPWARAIDYALILTCLFPVSAYKISQGSFIIGTNDLARVIPGFFQQKWLFIAMTAVFTIALVAFIIKTYREWKGGYINWPKTVFITITVAVACTMPALDNLDTAFQGLNTWHSFQYLALTFYIIRLRQQIGDMHSTSPVVNRFATRANSLKLYLFSFSMIAGSAVLGIAVYITVGIVDPTRKIQEERFVFISWRVVNGDDLRKFDYDSLSVVISTNHSISVEVDNMGPIST